MNFEKVRNMSPVALLLLAVGITFIVFVVTVLIIFFIWRAGNGSDPLVWDLWGMLEGISSALSFAVVVGGGAVILFQLVEAVDNRHLDVYDKVFTRWMSNEQIEARRYIYQELPVDPGAGIGSLTKEGQDNVKLILNSLDYLGFLIDQQWVNNEGIIEWVSPIVVKIWARLKPYVDYEIARRGEADYYQGAASLAARCAEYRKARYPDEEIVWLSDAL